MKNWILTIVALSVLLVACNEKPKPEPIPDPTLSITPSIGNVVLSATGDDVETFTVSTNQETWSVSCDDTWYIVTQNESDNTFTIRAEKNESLSPKEEATVTVSAPNCEDIVIKVTQAGEAPYLIIEPIDNAPLGIFNLPGDVTTKYNYYVYSNVEWEVITDNQPYTNVSCRAFKQTIDGRPGFYISGGKNNSIKPRSPTTVTVYAPDCQDITFTVTLAGATPSLKLTYISNNGGDVSSVIFTPDGRTRGGGTYYNVELITNTEDEWSVESDKTWCYVSSVTRLTEYGYFEITSSANTTLSRDAMPPATITVSAPGCQSVSFVANQPEGIKSYEPEMVFVPSGSFYMGASGSSNSQNIHMWPGHDVNLTNSYYIGKYEVTQAQWEAVMGSNPSVHKGNNRPVENISWEHIQQYIAKLNQLTGRNYRLPTEAEWEFATCKGDNSYYPYSGSSLLDDVAWYHDNSGVVTHNVGTKAPNERGIYDMSGNVWEWCSDWYGSYGSQTLTNPTGPSSGMEKVIRGGAFYSQEEECMRINRRSRPTTDYESFIGFRLVLPNY